LFEQLDAPDILKKQLPANLQPIRTQWPVKPADKKKILAAFAVFYAERHYVNEDLEATAELMQFVKKCKGRFMSRKETRLWLASCLFPPATVLKLKKIKKAIRF
jgi:hypothetical protein